MVDASQVYDTIQLTVTTGGFTTAQTRISNLITQLNKLGGMVTPINIDTSQITRAITQLQGLSRGMVPGVARPVARRALGTPIEGPAIYSEKMRRRAVEVRRFEEFKRMPSKYGVQARAAHLGALRGPARGEMEAAGVPYKTGLRDISTAAPKATADITKLNKEMGKTVAAANKVEKATPKATRAVKNLGKATKNASEKASAYTLTWKNMSMVMGKVAFWMVATGAIYGTMRAFKSMVDVIIKVDHAMADIEKVYRGAREDLIPLRNSLIELSVTLGGSSEATMEAAVGWAKLGYTGKQISELMRTSMLAMNIAELTAAESTKYLTAAMIQFRLGADDSLNVLDSWNELSNRTAATTRDLGEVVARAGKTYETMGDSIDYVNAVGATLVETMARSGEEVGTAMRTIGAYIYRPRTITKVKEISGVEIRELGAQGELTGGLKSQSQILGELAVKWGNLTDIQKVGLAQSVAGARRYQYFLNIMDNYDKVMRNLVISLNAAGSAERENARYMETIQKQLDQLRARFERAAVSAGDAGLAGTLKGLISVLSFLVDGLATVDFKMIALAVGMRVLVGLLIKLGKAIKEVGFRQFISGMGSSISTAGALNASLLVLIGTYHAIKYAINKATEASREYAQWQARTADMANKHVTATEADVKAMKGYRKAMEYYEDVAETTKDEKKRVDYLERAAKARAEYTARRKELGIVAEDAAEAEREADLMVVDSKNKYVASLADSVEGLEENIEITSEATKTIENFNDARSRDEKITANEVDSYNEACIVMSEYTQKIIGAEKGWDKFITRVIAGHTHFSGNLDMVKEYNDELKTLKDEQVKELATAQKDLALATDELTDSEEDLGKAVGDTGRKVDLLAELIKRLDEQIRPLNRSISDTEHNIKLYEYALGALEQTFGDYSSEMAEHNILTDDMYETYTKLIRVYGNKRTELQKNIEMLEKNRDAIIASGVEVSDYEDQWDSFQNKLREVDTTFLDLQQRMRDLPDEELEKFINILTGETATRRARGEAFSFALPSKAAAKSYYDDLTYTFDEMAAIAEETGQQMVSINALLRVEYMTRREIHDLLVDMGYRGDALAEMEERMIQYQEIKLGHARELNREYERLANTFQNIVDEGLFGIIMGEQTALDLAKELGREWADIALKTVTQPATEMFGAGMGGAAYFMKHGKLPPAMEGGIADVKLKDGRVPVYDEALAGAVMAAGQAGGLGTAGGFGAAGVQGAGQPGAGGVGTLGTIMPIARGMMAGGLMGAGGGGAGAGFGAMMGGLGTAVSMIPGVGQILGAGISMLGLLGNLFGGRKHEEEDPYARQQASGMGERSVTIGSAGTVNNYVHMTIYYESLTDRENVSQLYDDLEEEGITRGYQVTGSAAPTTV